MEYLVHVEALRIMDVRSRFTYHYDQRLTKYASTYHPLSSHGTSILACSLLVLPPSFKFEIGHFASFSLPSFASYLSHLLYYPTLGLRSPQVTDHLGIGD